jgi:hypothetical protein
MKNNWFEIIFLVNDEIKVGFLGFKFIKGMFG